MESLKAQLGNLARWVLLRATVLIKLTRFRLTNLESRWWMSETNAVAHPKSPNYQSKKTGRNKFFNKR